MKLLLLIAILAIVALLATSIVIALYAHKKSGTGTIKLIGEVGYVDAELTPVGTVIVAGELWKAKSKDNATLRTRSRIRVVGFADQLAIVEPCE
ncbi:MAG TPA: NfeD family protein [Pyrinomonadaceae bacterium]|nr:NfeD family protein [Pyrinomonadaceae bacterium]